MALLMKWVISRSQFCHFPTTNGFTGKFETEERSRYAFHIPLQHFVWFAGRKVKRGCKASERFFSLLKSINLCSIHRECKVVDYAQWGDIDGLTPTNTLQTVS